jgi:beta-galactosidase
MRTGVCYYPEQWPRQRWATDAAWMADLGLDLVRIGEFAWSSYEPQRGRFDFAWLDEAIEVLAGAGLQVVLGTPTATPPVWLVRERPEIVSVGPDGRPRPYGSRRHTSTSSRAYRQEAARIVEVLVARYGHHPAVVAWQVDNEPGNHDSARCWSAESERAFQAWLSARFDGDIDALNAAWGTAFWSMAYPSFDAVELPRPTVTDHNPSLEVAHLAFAAAQAAEGLAEQRAIITAGSPGREMFTNLYLGDIDIDPRQVARPTGLGSVDIYPHGLEDAHEVGFVLDLARGSALGPDAGPADRGGRAWIVEQQPGPVNWTGDNPAVPAGQVRLWCWQAALHGVETLLWFRWRAARAGQEQHHAALLRHDGTRSPAWDEAARFLRELREVEATAPKLVERPPARVALVHDHLDAWMLEVIPQVPDAGHRRLVTAAHAAARRLALDVDVVPDDADLTGYEVVLAPALHVVTPARLARLEAALDAGVQVVLGPRSLVRDEHAVWVDVPVPAGLSSRLGARIEHAGSPSGWPRDADHPSELVLDDPRNPLPVGGWIETFTEVEATTQVLGRARGGPLDGAAVVVRRDGLTLLGAASEEAWTATLALLLGHRPRPDHLEVFERDRRHVVLDHRSRTIGGLGRISDRE